MQLHVFFFLPGDDLLSRDPAVRVPSALESLTSVFGMGTGVTSPLLPPDDDLDLSKSYLCRRLVPSKLHNTCGLTVRLSPLTTLVVTIVSIQITSKKFRSSPRPISIGQLNTLLRLHFRPINHVVYMGSYQPTLWEILS